MTRSPTLRRASPPSAGAYSPVTDRQLLDVMRDRNRFLSFLHSLEREPKLADHRIEEGFAMARSLARRARQCFDLHREAGNELAASTLLDLLQDDFRRAAAIAGGLIISIELHAE